MTTTSAQQTVFEELVIATKILLHEGILDTFGHICARDPEDPNAFFLAQKLYLIRKRQHLFLYQDD